MIRPDAWTVRTFRPEDACAVSELFACVYGARYVYPDVYLPSRIAERNRSGHWRSAVAEADGRVIGHAALVGAAGACAELAMVVVLPQAQGGGIAGALGRYLCDVARLDGQWALLTIKQVSSHRQTQRLALALGFQTTGLLLDYVTSPFDSVRRESVVLGCLSLRPPPGTVFRWPMPVAPWLSALAWAFELGGGPRAGGDVRRLSWQGERLDIDLDALDTSLLADVRRLPSRWLTYLTLPLDGGLKDAVALLESDGFASGGLMPVAANEWRWLMQRGYAVRPLALQCRRAQALHAQLMSRREVDLCF